MGLSLLNAGRRVIGTHDPLGHDSADIQSTDSMAGGKCDPVMYNPNPKPVAEVPVKSQQGKHYRELSVRPFWLLLVKLPAKAKPLTLVFPHANPLGQGQCRAAVLALPLSR